MGTREISVADMRIIIIFSLCLLWVEGLPSRAKRDVTCASYGHTSCSLSCRLRGRAGGNCSWDSGTGAYNCSCQEERRGVRCNVGGENVCHYSCKALGHTAGLCDEDYNCKCSGENTGWGRLLQNI